MSSYRTGKISDDHFCYDYKAWKNNNKKNIKLFDQKSSSWQSIHDNFTPELQRYWEHLRFSYDECKKWIATGLLPSDAAFAWWLRDVKGKDIEWVLENNGYSKEIVSKYNEYIQKYSEEENSGYLEDKNKESRKEYINVQEWLDQNYAKEDRKKIRCLYIENKNLEGHLDLSEFVSLRDLKCGGNKLTNISLGDCPNLERFSCNDNCLTSIEFLTKLVNPEKLTVLMIDNNDFETQDIDFLSKFISLETLFIGSLIDDEKEKRNHFTGSLGSLKNLSSLQIINVSNTDIEEGIEYLPKSVKIIICLSKSYTACEKIVKKLADYQKEWEIGEGRLPYFDYPSWRKDNMEKVELAQIGKLVSAQEWLDKEFSVKERDKVTEIDTVFYWKLSNFSDFFSRLLDKSVGIRNLKGSLNLKGFTNLILFRCAYNRINSLDLSGCTNLKNIYCFNNNQLTSFNCKDCSKLENLVLTNNHLTNVKFLTELLSPEKLTILDIRGNNISSASLVFLKPFINLEKLYLGGSSATNKLLSNKGDGIGEREALEETLNYVQNEMFGGNISEEKIQAGIYNRFYGSLEPLKGMIKLQELDISNTDIDWGLEYLPSGLEEIVCYVDLMKEGEKVPKVKGIFRALKNYKIGGKTGSYNYQEWRKDNFNLISKPIDYDFFTFIRDNLGYDAEYILNYSNMEELWEDYQKNLENYKLQQSLEGERDFWQQTQIKPNLKHLIGKGGYGEVYYGEWKSQDVAIKKLYLSPLNTSEYDLKDIQKEIDILKNLRNRYIIQYYGTYSDDKEILIIMDYAENGTLTRFINDNKVKEHDWNFNNELIRQVMLGLVYIHHEKVIHRDLKSMNILLTKNYEAKISDFGLSKTKIISSSQSKHSNVGTLRWMAPETLKEKKYSEHSDIYSLGMVIWEIAAKCTIPFKEFSDALVMFKVFDNKKEIIPADTPQIIQNIIQQCWKDNPEERVTLENMLKMIESDKSNSQKSIYTKVSLNLFREQGPQEISEQFYRDSLSTDSFKPLYLLNNVAELSNELDVYFNNHPRNLAIRSKRQSSLPVETQGESKSVKLSELVTEPMEEDYTSNWITLHPIFTFQLIQSWTNLNFTPQQTQDWINIGLQPTDYNFCTWLRDTKCLTSEQVLNHYNLEQLNQEFFTYWQEQQSSTGLIRQFKRQLSIDSQTKNTQGESKEIRHLYTTLHPFNSFLFFIT